MGRISRASANAIYQRYFEQLQAGGHLYEDGGAWRFRSPRGKVVVDDQICGRIEFDLTNPETHPDMTIRRPDGSWIFHFVNVVDDLEMQITDVIRGRGSPFQYAEAPRAFRALGAAPPRYAHIPLILNPDGTQDEQARRGREHLQLHRRRLRARGGAELPLPARLVAEGRPREDRDRGGDRALRAAAA